MQTSTGINFLNIYRIRLGNPDWMPIEVPDEDTINTIVIAQVGDIYHVDLTINIIGRRSGIISRNLLRRYEEETAGGLSFQVEPDDTQSVRIDKWESDLKFLGTSQHDLYGAPTVSVKLAGVVKDNPFAKASAKNDWSSKYDDPWVCDFCGEKFDWEVDLLAHQFNSPCEPNR